MADSAWMQQMAEAEEAAEQQQVQQDEVATEPALSPRSTEHVVPPEQPVQERPVFGLQPAPPPRADRPHRTTQQWLQRNPQEAELRYYMQQDDLQHQMEQKRLAHLEAEAHWEEQMQQQNPLPQHERVPRRSTCSDNHDRNIDLKQHQMFMQNCDNMIRQIVHRQRQQFL